MNINKIVCMFALRKTSVQPFTCYTVVFKECLCLSFLHIKTCIYAFIYIHTYIHAYISLGKNYDVFLKDIPVGNNLQYTK